MFEKIKDFIDDLTIKTIGCILFWVGATILFIVGAVAAFMTNFWGGIIVLCVFLVIAGAILAAW